MRGTVPLYLVKFNVTPRRGQAGQGAGGPTPERRAAAGSQRGKLLGQWRVRSLSTTVLLTVEETLEALRQAQSLAYRPPGG
jgi:hypothetical protein